MEQELDLNLKKDWEVNNPSELSKVLKTLEKIQKVLILKVKWFRWLI